MVASRDHSTTNLYLRPFFANHRWAPWGLSEEDARNHYGAIDVYSSEFRPLKHTLSGRNEKTLMKLIADRESQKVIGIHIVGGDAPEIVQGFAVAVKSGLTKERFDCTIGIHPTAAEELVTMRSPLQG